MTPAPAASPRWLRQPLTAGLWLGAAIVLCYAASFTAPFLFDDMVAVVDNPTIRHLGLAALSPPTDGSTTTGRPVVNLSFALNYAVSGESVWSYHALNLAIHVGAVLALFGVVRSTLQRTTFVPRESAGTVAFFAALIWGTHPLLTESVVCVAQRTESLCGMLMLFALYAFIRSTETDGNSRRWGVISVGTCLVGMATKELMVTMPVLLLLYDRTFVADTFAGAWRARCGTYLALAATWLLLVVLLLKGGGSRGVAAGFGHGVSAWDYLLKQAEALVLYAKLAVWPHPLVLDYGTAVAHSLSEVWWQGACVLTALGFTVWALVRRPVLGFAGAWFFVILAPSSSFVPLVTQTMAEHRMYLPLAALVVTLMIVLHRELPRAAMTVSVGLALVLGAATFVRTLDYGSDIGIWKDTVKKYPSSARAYNNLAWSLQRAGQTAEANPYFAHAVELEPTYVSARYNWGVALLDQGRADESITQFEQAVNLLPSHGDARLNLGNALMQVGRATEAVPQYEEALRLSPGADAHFDLGVALLEIGRIAEAEGHLRSALALRPDLIEAHYQLGRAAEGLGRSADAEREYGEVLKAKSNHLSAHRRLGLLYARAERFAQASEQFQAVIRLAPNDADAHANLGNVLLIQGHAQEAITQYEETLRLRPNDARTRESLQLAREALR